jgi:uncharacterized protein (DUF885 family)
MSARRLAAALLIMAAGQSAAAPADELIARYSSGYRHLGMTYLALSYRDNIGNLVRETNIAEQKSWFTEVTRALKLIDRVPLSPCQRLDLDRIAFEAVVNLHKLTVLEQYAALGNPDAGTGGLYTAPAGRAWYRYFLKRWLSSDVTPEQLMASGKVELQAVLARYRRLQAAMGYAGRDAAFYAYLNSPQFTYPPGQTPRADYEARQATVFANLHKLFPPHAIKPAAVRESTRGNAFPADGYYESDSRTFYFNKNGPVYQKRNLDMLLLHESTPGHHFQSQYAQQAGEQAGGCPATLPPVFYSAFAEGWSAYVEQFGAELGLYQQPADALGAVEWDLVRSIRVVLDVGINYEGWSEQRAHAYWREQLPMLPQLAAREITRVRDWPVQAIAYKYGAATIGQLRDAEQARLGDAFDIKTFHHTLLRNGALPLAVLPSLFGQ